MQMHWIDAAIILLSLAIVMVVGWRAGRRENKTARDYFLASDQLPWYAIGASWVATSVSSEQIVGTVGMAYEVGMGIANWEWFSWPIITLLLVFFIPIYFRTKISTIPEFLTRRFGPFCGDFYSVVMLVAYVFIFLPTILYSGALAFSDITSIPFWIVLSGTVVLVGVYTIRGGLAAVVWTDVIQCIMLVGGGLVLFFVALGHIPGGWDEMASANPERFHLIKPASDPYAPFLGLMAGSIGVFLFYNASNQVMIQRVLGARTRWDGLMGIIFSGFINMVRPLVTCFLGFVVFYYCSQRGEMLQDSNLTFSFAVKTFGPTGLRGIIMAGFIAAVMGAASSLTNSASTIFTLSIFKRFVRAQASELATVRVGRWTSAVVLLISALWSPLVGKADAIFTYFQTGVTYLATPFIAVSLVGIFWRRPGRIAGSVGLLGGLVIQICIAVGARILFLRGYVTAEIHWLYLAFAAEILTIVLVILVSVFTDPPPPDKVEEFIWKPALLKRELATARPWYKSLLLWYAVYSSIWFSVYLYFR
jgi:solute:Na+ symporter, SSS family